jgi:hypothetical protein
LRWAAIDSPYGPAPMMAVSTMVSGKYLIETMVK